MHRDVKPSNVLITDEAGEDFAYLIDFGIARDAVGPTLTGTGVTVGTLSYMAPERYLGRSTDHRVDVYSLGCLLYEALTGSRPFPGEDFPTQMYAHLDQPPPRPSAARPGIPIALDEVVARAMAKDPVQRYPHARELSTAARATLAAPPDHLAAATHVAAPGVRPPLTRAEPEFPLPHSPGPRPRRRALLAAAVALTAALTVGVVATDPGRSPVEPEALPDCRFRPEATGDQSARPASGGCPWTENLGSSRLHVGEGADRYRLSRQNLRE